MDQVVWCGRVLARATLAPHSMSWVSTAVVVRDLAFDEYRAALVLACFADRVGQFPAGCRSQAQPVAVLGVPGVDQAGVVPVLEELYGPS